MAIHSFLGLMPLSRPSLDEARALVVTRARSWIGVRWRHLGRTRNGVDCVGLVLAAGEGFHDYPDEENYTRLSSGRDMLEHFQRHSSEVPLGPEGLAALADGDILLMRDTAFPQHVGIIASKEGHSTLIHASIAHRCVVEERIDDEIRRRAITGFKFRVLK